MSRLYVSKAGLLSLAGACVLACWPAKDARATVTCTATMTGINFGNVDMVVGTGFSTSGTLSYTCTNNSSRTYFRACFNLGDGFQSIGSFNPRLMANGANTLTFQLYHGGTTVWGSNGNAFVPNPVVVSARFDNNNSPITGQVPISGTIFPGQGAKPAGNYSNDLSGVHNSITLSENTGSVPTTCGTGNTDKFDFTVQANVIKSCAVTAGAASNIQLGAAGGVDATATNIMGNNTIGVTCSSGTPYFIGLRPSNNNNSGAGVMSALNIAPVTGNTDTIPYQLRSAAGMAGQIWGNTATATAVGNGVARTGSGANQSVTVYATTPNANFTPDSYADTVTVIVNY